MGSSGDSELTPLESLRVVFLFRNVMRLVDFLRGSPAELREFNPNPVLGLSPEVFLRRFRPKLIWNSVLSSLLVIFDVGDVSA